MPFPLVESIFPQLSHSFINWSIIALQFVLVSAVLQSESALYIPSILILPSKPFTPTQVITELQAEFLVLYRYFAWSMYLIHGSCI